MASLLLTVAVAAVAAWAAPEAGAPASVEVPAGSFFSVELVDPVSTGKVKAGDSFRARVLEGVWVKGAVAVPPNATVRGEIVESVPSGRVKGKAELKLTLRSLELDGRSYEVKTETLSYTGEGHAGRTLGEWLGGALKGAVLGVLFGGGKGAIIGAGAGAAAGGGVAVVKGKAEIEFPQGARLLFESRAPLAVPAYAPPPAAPKPEAKDEPKPAAKPSS